MWIMLWITLSLGRDIQSRSDPEQVASNFSPLSRIMTTTYMLQLWSAVLVWKNREAEDRRFEKHYVWLTDRIGVH
jgi:hypothetical protein